MYWTELSPKKCLADVLCVCVCVCVLQETCKSGRIPARSESRVQYALRVCACFDQLHVFDQHHNKKIARKKTFVNSFYKKSGKKSKNLQKKVKKAHPCAQSLRKRKLSMLVVARRPCRAGWEWGWVTASATRMLRHSPDSFA